jgi:hypothetical protein
MVKRWFQKQHCLIWLGKEFASPLKGVPRMTGSSRRYEVLLPLRYNDGKAVPDELLLEAVFELRKKFKAASSETQVIRGYWQDGGQEFRDELIRLFVDVADTPENQQFFLDFKERMKAKFGQLEIWVTSFPIDVL